MAGVLSYLVPGLGQIFQGRVAKGILFLVCIYALFFYGIYLGTGTATYQGRTYHASTAVYLPDLSPDDDQQSSLRRLASNLYNRPQFVGQFWVGVAAWPSILQYNRYDRNARRAYETVERAYNDAATELVEGQNALEKARKAQDEQAQDEAQKKIERANQAKEKAAEDERKLGLPLLGDFEREPSTASYNVVTNAKDKRMELAWVFTVIAGVLNILVIYDAVAGPAHAVPASREK
jgi:hypothetical protein